MPDPARERSGLKEQLWRLPAIAGALLALAQAAPAWADGALQAQGYSFVLTLPDGRALASPDLVGAVLEMDDPSGRPVRARIDRVGPAEERPDIMLHDLSVQDPATGAWSPMCDPDAQGRRAAFPVPGRWAGGAFVKDRSAWFLTCTAGAQGKCILWGYDPWRPGARGEDLAVYYQACEHMVRADYAGDGVPHTRNGIAILIWDIAGIRPVPEGPPVAAYPFEAGWGPDGAVCAAHTRQADLLSLQALLKSAPRLAAHPCDEAEARRRGALLFNGSSSP
jgi:hypothetical protein